MPPGLSATRAPKARRPFEVDSVSPSPREVQKRTSQTYKGDNDSFFIQDDESEIALTSIEHPPSGDNQSEPIEISDTEGDSRRDEEEQLLNATETHTKERTASDLPERDHTDRSRGGKRLRRLTGYPTQVIGLEVRSRKSLNKVSAPLSPKLITSDGAVSNQRVVKSPKTITDILNLRINNYRLLTSHVQLAAHRNHSHKQIGRTEEKLREELRSQIEGFEELARSVQMGSTTLGRSDDLDQLILSETYRSHCQALVRALEIWETERDRLSLRRKRALLEAMKQRVGEMLGGG